MDPLTSVIAPRRYELIPVGRGSKIHYRLRMVSSEQACNAKIKTIKTAINSSRIKIKAEWFKRDRQVIVLCSRIGDLDKLYSLLDELINDVLKGFDATRAAQFDAIATPTVTAPRTPRTQPKARNKRDRLEPRRQQRLLKLKNKQYDLHLHRQFSNKHAIPA